nr:MAG TPA: hypothetical protein [Caudoviricetes sp.]
MFQKDCPYTFLSQLGTPPTPANSSKTLNLDIKNPLSYYTLLV